jgi:ElaB/YqjD/DUF883 family membrane-anchored ribosome-binding protein
VGEETARLRDEIDRTREDLTRDVDMLADKTSPSRIVERRVERTRRGIGRGFIGLKEKVMGSSEDARHRATYGATYGPTYTDDVYATERRPVDHDTSTSYGMGDRLSSAKESTSDAATQAKERVAHAGERAQESAHDAVSGVRQQAEGNPFAAGLVAFGIGWLISSLMPASDAETQAAQRAGDAAREHGGPLVEQAKQAVQEVSQELQGPAQDAAQQIKDRAQNAAGSVKEEART